MNDAPRLPHLQRVYGPAHSINTSPESLGVDWLLSELNLVHFQLRTTEEKLAVAELGAAQLRAQLLQAKAPAPKKKVRKPEAEETWLVETALKGAGEPEWLVRSGYATQEAAQAEVRQLGPGWRRKGFQVRTRRVVGAE